MELEHGSLFIPVSVLDEKARQPYDPITATQEGSYWLLVAPNSYAPGFFSTPGSQEAKESCAIYITTEPSFWGCCASIPGHSRGLMQSPRLDGHAQLRGG